MKRNTEELLVCHNYFIQAKIQHWSEFQQGSAFLLDCTVHVGIFLCPHHPCECKNIVVSQHPIWKLNLFIWVLEYVFVNPTTEAVSGQMRRNSSHFYRVEKQLRTVKTQRTSEWSPPQAVLSCQLQRAEHIIFTSLEDIVLFFPKLDVLTSSKKTDWPQ